MGRIWTQERITKAIRGLIQNNISFSGKKICKDKSAKTRSIIKKSCGHRVNGRGLHDAAKRYFGNWTNALKVAGLKYESHCYWNRQTVINCIKELHRLKFSLRFEDLNFDSSKRLNQILYKHSGRASSGSALANAGRRHFGTWKAAVEAAGVEFPRYVRPPVLRWKRQEIVSAVLFVSKFYEDLRVRSLWGAEYKNFRKLLARKFAQELSARKLYRDTKVEFGSWRSAIEFSGLDSNRFLNSHFANRKMFNIALVEHHVESHLASDGRFERFIYFSHGPLSGEDYLLRQEFEDRLDSFVYSLPVRARAFCSSLLDILLGAECVDLIQATKAAQAKDSNICDEDVKLVIERLTQLLSS